jgi:hypothetical protein
MRRLFLSDSRFCTIPKDYGRHDSGVLYFDKSDYEVVREVLQVLYGENQSYFQPEVPLFTMQLAPGLGLAEEPDQKFADRESFGMIDARL